MIELGGGLCGCGKPARYISHNGGSCNKYVRCPTYDELREQHKKAFNELYNVLFLAESLLMYKEDTDFYKDSKRLLEHTIDKIKNEGII